jgi:hypothetical protein
LTQVKRGLRCARIFRTDAEEYPTLTERDLIEAIRQRAYEIWLAEGCPHGRDHVHWLRAEAEFRERIAEAHAADRCKTGLHEKPVEPRNKKRRASQGVAPP